LRTLQLSATLAGAIALLALPGSARAESGTNEEDESSLERGHFVVRGSANLDLNKSINIGGNNSGETVGGGVNLGVGYFVLSGLSLDLDLDLRFLVAPKAELTTLGVTPGLRYYPIPQVYLRAGLPIVLIPNFGLGALGGAGFRQKIVTNTYFVIGVDYTYWMTESFRAAAPGGRLDINAGVQAHF